MTAKRPTLPVRPMRPMRPKCDTRAMRVVLDMEVCRKAFMQSLFVGDDFAHVSVKPKPIAPSPLPGTHKKGPYR